MSAGPVVVQDRLWFNEANESRYFLVPGLIVLIMTLIGALLTALVVAREWERGTLEALFVTPVRAGEILLGKTIPYFALGMIGLGLCLLAAKFLFHVPFRGSLGVLIGVSMLYLLVALGIGLSISSAVKNQFVAIQLTMLFTFMPAFMLSGFLFDLRSMPAAVRWLPICCRRATTSRCCKRFFWPETCGASFCPMRPYWPAWRPCSYCSAGRQSKETA